MAVPAGENIYDVQGTILYRVISEEQHSREMAGYSAVADEGADGSAAITNTINANASNMNTTRANKIMSGTAGVAANLNAQRSVSAAAAAALAASSSPQSTQRKPTRLDPITSTKGRTAADVTGALPTRGQPLTATAGGSGKTLNGTAAALWGAGDDGAPATNTLTVEKALGALIAATPLESDPAEDIHGGDDDAVWLKVPALDHTSRLDVVLLYQHLMRRCEEEHARPRGVLCPTRESIFDNGMTEVTRQVTVLCPERGYLLHELVKGMGQNTETYDVLADNASQYAVRKATERDLRQHLQQEKTELESEVRRIENRVNELRAKYDGLKKRFEEQTEANGKMRDEEVAYLKTANQQLVNEIKRLSNLEAAQKAA